MIGPKVRELRQQKGLSVNELARVTGFTPSYISQLERNMTDPSISSLRKISSALEVPIYTFLEDDNRQNVIIRSDKRQKFELPDSTLVFEFITPTGFHKGINAKMEIIYFKLEPKSYSGEELLTHRADECIFVIKGEVDIYLGDECHHLFEGDSVYILENTPHKLYNPTHEIVIGTSTVCPPLY